MDEQTANLVHVTLAVGGAVLTLLLALLGLAWKISRGLADRDALLNQAMEKIGEQSEKLDSHEDTCIVFRDETNEKFQRGQRRFDRIEYGLRLVMAKLNVEEPLMPPLSEEGRE